MFCEFLMNFFPDFAPNCRKEWRVSLFNQFCENKLENCWKFWNLWKWFNIIIQCYSFVSLVVRGCPLGGTSRRSALQRAQPGERVDLGCDRGSTGKERGPKSGPAIPNFFYRIWQNLANIGVASTPTSSPFASDGGDGDGGWANGREPSAKIKWPRQD